MCEYEKSVVKIHRTFLYAEFFVRYIDFQAFVADFIDCMKFANSARHLV